jgi:hypothetical protein
LKQQQVRLSSAIKLNCPIHQTKLNTQQKKEKKLNVQSLRAQAKEKLHH